MKVKDLTPEQQQWLIDNFPNTKNAEVAAYLNTSLRGAIRMARELGLWKTKEFVSEMQRNAAQEAGRVLRLRGGNRGTKNLLKYGVKYRFKKGENNYDRMPKEKVEAMHKKSGETRRKLYEDERRRVRWGLEQKTKLRVTRCSSKKKNLRYGLRLKGYIIERASNDALITDSTNRSPLMEQRAESLGMKFYLND